MPRIAASMADVSTDYNPIEPGVHRYEVEEIKEITDENTNRVQYHITSRVVSVEDGGKEEDVGRKYTDRIHIHKKDGEINEFGLAQLKRYFEVCVGDEEANDPEADTDWLLNQQFLAQTEISHYTVKDRLTGDDVKRSRNELSRLAPVQ